MPTYEYECDNGHTFDVQQRMTDPPLERCTVCSSQVRRLISAAPFILKGGGWYSDGYSSGGDGKGASDKASTDSSSNRSKSSSSGDSSSKSSSSDSSSA
jgi:putative FmdB family regulatory protein